MILIQYLAQDIFKTDQFAPFIALELIAEKNSSNLKLEFFAQDLFWLNPHLMTLFSENFMNFQFFSAIKIEHLSTVCYQ